MDLSIIIVNYRSADLLADCLRSILLETSGISFEILVVDNASGDDSRSLITREFPMVKWIQLDTNAGFSRANNAGIRESKGDVILLLNPDTIIEKRAIENCFRLFSESAYVACGVQLLNADRSPQISGNYFKTGALNFLLPLPVTGSIVKWLGGITKSSIPHANYTTQTVEVDWINGAFLMLKKSVLEQAGLLDEDFFLYFEEVEWCSRLKKAGRLAIFGQCNVLHLQGESANVAFGSYGKGYYNLSDRKGRQIMLSGMLRVRKQFGPFWFLFHLFAYTITILFYWIFYFLQHLFLFRNPIPGIGNPVGFTRNVLEIWKWFFHLLLNRSHFYKV